MENRKISMISELALSQDDYTIKVCVIRLWRQTSWNQQLRMIRMILMDEMGSKIECNVDKPFASLQGKSFEEYGDYYIHKPTLGLNEDFQQLHHNAINPKISFDVIGNVFRCFQLEPAKNRQEKKITFKMEDLEGHEVFVTLWGRYADEINAYVSKNTGHFVLLIQCAKLKLVRDRPYVNNTYLATKLYIEDDIEEITTFKKRLCI
ncbi:hypothetical protein Lser_V15G18137 [Lactuca serriola]